MPRYRESLPTLAELVAELDAALVDREGHLSADDLLSAASWLGLPRYAGMRSQTGAAQLLLADITDYVEQLDGRERLYARTLIRQADPTELRGKRKILASQRLGYKSEGGAARELRVASFLARLALALYQRAVHIVEPDHELDFGFHSIEHDWSVSITVARPEREVYVYTSTARAIRPGQRFYVFGDDLDGARLVRKPTIRRRELQRYVGTVRADESNPNILLHVVYLGRAYDVGELVTVTLRRVSDVPDLSAPRGIFFQGRGADIRRVRLSANVPRSLATAYERVDRSERSVLPQPQVEPVLRSADDPMYYEIDPVEEGHEYELAWSMARRQ